MHMMNRPIHLGLELADNHRVSRATNAAKLQANTSNTNKHQSYYSSSRGGGNPFSSIFRLSKRWLHGLAGSLHVAVQISDAFETGEGQHRRNVFVEVERAVGLPRGGRRTAPFVILFLNGTEIGRTPPVKVMENQAYTWVDETYEFPVCDGCRDISFQLWNMKSNDEQVGEFLGEAKISVESIIEKQREAAEEPEDSPVVELSLDLKLWSDSNDDRDDGRSCCCPLHRPPNGPSHISTPDETKNDAGEYAQAGPPKLSPFKIHAASQRSRHPLRRPPEAKATTKSPYRIPNPDPYRRRDVRGAFDAEVGGSCLSSTFCRALGLIGIYLLFGVTGFSVCFEDLSIRDGLYLSVVTFSTVGFGDVPIKTKGGKLFPVSLRSRELASSALLLAISGSSWFRLRCWHCKWPIAREQRQRLLQVKLTPKHLEQTKIYQMSSHWKANLPKRDWGNAKFQICSNPIRRPTTSHVDSSHCCTDFDWIACCWSVRRVGYG